MLARENSVYLSKMAHRIMADSSNDPYKTLPFFSGYSESEMTW